MSSNETLVRSALAGVLCNALNYPEGVSHTVLGRDMSVVIDKAVEAVMATGRIETVDSLFFRPEVDRVEVIDDRGRAYVSMDADEVMTALQDGGKTLKVFLMTRA